MGLGVRGSCAASACARWMATRQTATTGGVSAGGSLSRLVLMLALLALLGAPPEMAGVCSASSPASLGSALTACR